MRRISAASTAGVNSRMTVEATRYGIWWMRIAWACLGRVRRLGQLTQGESAAVRRRVLVEQNLLRSRRRRDVQQRIQPLHGLAGHEHRAVEPTGVRLALAQVARHFRAQRPRGVAKQAEGLQRRLGGRCHGRGRAVGLLTVLAARLDQALATVDEVDNAAPPDTVATAAAWPDPRRDGRRRCSTAT